MCVAGVQAVPNFPNLNSDETGEGSSLPSSFELSDVARIWAYRHRVEYEAADQFERMAVGLAALGSDPKITRLAHKAAEDERRHAVLCRNVIAQTHTEVAFGIPQLGIRLGPHELDLRKKILYAAVSLSCVTETLSTALLIEMQKQAETRAVRETVHSILEDEILHSRIGWAHLAHQANHMDVSWLRSYIPLMIQDAVASDTPSVPIPAEPDFSAWGILPPEKAKAIMQKTVNEIILPGLRAFGID